MLDHVAGLIRLPALRPPILDGLAISIGGLDAQLAAAAGSALIDAISSASAAAGTVDGPQLASQLLLGVTDCVLAIWSRQPRCALPATVTLHPASNAASELHFSLAATACVLAISAGRALNPVS